MGAEFNREHLMSARLFIRNDDVWTLDHEFRFFFDLAKDRGIPVVHAVIPGKMDQGLIRFLCRAKEKTPQLLDIVQHGWIHANHSLDGGQQNMNSGLRAVFECPSVRISGRGKKKCAWRLGSILPLRSFRRIMGMMKAPYGCFMRRVFRFFQPGHAGQRQSRRFIEIPAQISFSRYEQGHDEYSYMPGM